MAITFDLMNIFDSVKRFYKHDKLLLELAIIYLPISCIYQSIPNLEIFKKMHFFTKFASLIPKFNQNIMFIVT